MQNVRINEAETIFEPFWDSGDTYPGHQKYSRLTPYTLETGSVGRIYVGWQSVRVDLEPDAAGDFPVKMTRSCALDIREYDRFRLFASIAKEMEFRIRCVIDGEEHSVLQSVGNNTFCEYTGDISGSLISGITLEFRNLSAGETSADLAWMGLSNAAREADMLAQPSPYTPDWEGCFAEEAELSPQTGLYFDSEGLSALREKLETPLFSPGMENLRRQAREWLSLEPEKDIGPFVSNHYRNFVRDRDLLKMNYNTQAMNVLAFVGLVDENIPMLRMACRIALSVAHCDKFCESIMGAFPGATWHHRAFLEASLSTRIMNVLDWAGGLLSWHGKNVLYEAVIMKGLPRIDADIKTMDYIWYMNQGIIFASEYLIILLGLSRRYPRYETRIAETEKDLFAMWANYAQKDGGTTEGPTYWSFTLSFVRNVCFLLAKYHGKSLEEAVPESIRKSGLFAEALLSDSGYSYVPINDAAIGKTYLRQTVKLMAALNAGDIWREMSNALLESDMENVNWDDLIFEEYYDLPAARTKKQEYLSFPCAGHTVLRRDTREHGTVSLHLVSGAISFGHAHGDKGSLLLDVGGHALLIDRGVGSYADPYDISRAEIHNVTVPVIGGKLADQDKNDPACSGIVTEDRYENGTLTYTTDVTPCWNGLFRKNLRSVRTDDPFRYEVCDRLELPETGTVAFILNTNGTVREENGTWILEDGGISLTVKPENWTPARADFGIQGKDGKERPVTRLCLYAEGSNAYELLTSLELHRGSDV